MKRIDQPPIGIIVTWGKEMIREKGGLLSFIRFFELNMNEDGDTWMQKSKNKPIQDILYVYVIVCNQVRYKLFYGGYQKGETEAWNGDGIS